jgi:hypothetical protein
MLARLILAATTVAALAAFVRNDDPIQPVPSREQPPAVAGTSDDPNPIQAAPAAAATPTAARPVRVVLAPLYATSGPTIGAADRETGFIPTPGSPLGKRGADIAVALPQAGKAVRDAEHSAALRPADAGHGPTPRARVRPALQSSHAHARPTAEQRSPFATSWPQDGALPQVMLR